MPAERTIDGVKYYSVKKNSVTYCAQCGRKIPIVKPAYAKGSRTSGTIFCRECVIALSERYQYERYGRVPFPESELMYVGTVGHTCLLLDDTNYILKTAIFRRANRSAYLPVHLCTKCSRYFIEQNEFEKNREILMNYRLIHTITDKPIPGSKDWTMDYRPSSKEDNPPATVVWAYQHPYQGGGCSGK